MIPGTQDPDPHEDAWWNWHPGGPEPQVGLDPDREEPPRLLGPDGEPIPRLSHLFGFRARMEWR